MTTDKMMLAYMFTAATAVIAVVVILCMAVSKRRFRKKESLDEWPEIPAEIYEQAAYERHYIHAEQDTFSSNKTIRIRPAYYDRLRRITQTAGSDNLSLIAYLDHVLRAHFEEHEIHIEHFCRDIFPDGKQ